MIAKQIKGKSFSGILKYMEEKVKKGTGELIDSNMIGSTASELAKEFQLIAQQKPNLKKKYTMRRYR